MDENQGAKDRAVMMLATIDFLLGGKLAKLKGDPEDRDLMRICNLKRIIIELATWEQNDRSGNWVRSIEGVNNKKTDNNNKDDDNYTNLITICPDCLNNLTCG